MKNFKLMLVVFAVFFIGKLPLSGQSFTNIDSTYNRIINVEFDAYSFELTSKVVEVLNQNSHFIKKKISDHCGVVLGDMSSPNEIKSNINIGLFRARNIINFYEKEYALQRNYFYIVDSHYSGSFDNESNIGKMELRFICD